MSSHDGKRVAIFGIDHQRHWKGYEYRIRLVIERSINKHGQQTALVLGSSMLAYNLLRWIGQNGLLGPKSSKRHPEKGRRIKTVMQELMYVAARIIQTAHTIKLSFGKGCRSIEAYRQVFN